MRYEQFCNTETCSSGAFAGSVEGAAAVQSIRCDFARGIPSDWTLIDRDANELSQDVARFGFSQGDAWVAYRIESEDNAVACSTSWYAAPGTSSDWMILPDLEVTESSVLSWRAMAGDARFRDGYAVYAAPAGASSPEEFDTSAPLFATDAEEGNWTAHTLSLARFAGKSIRLAFVNNSTDCQCLFVDDIVAGTPSPLVFESTVPNFAVLGNGLQISGFVQTGGEETLHGVSLTLSVDGETYSADFPDITVAPGERVPLSWTPGFIPARKGDYSLQLTVRSGKLEDVCEETVRAVSHKIVFEEGTGSWCSWCVRGIATMEKLSGSYPDNFIGIAVHENDPMALDNYTIYDLFGTSGVPKAKVNRGVACDPSQAEGHFFRELETVPCGALDFTVSYDKETRLVETETGVSFSDFYADKDYRLAYVVTENGVHHPGERGYSQRNGYAAGENGEMGGFENKPDPIPSEDMWFEEVARGLMSPFDGIAGVVPRSMKALETAEYSLSFTLPSNVDNPEKAVAIVMLIDNETGAIINAESAPVTGNSAVSTIESDNVRIVPVSGGVRIEGEGIIEGTLYSIDGRPVARGTEVLKAEGEGIYILRVNTIVETIVRKILIRNR